MSLEALKPELDKAVSFAEYSGKDKAEKAAMLDGFETLANRVLVTETDPFKAAVQVKSQLRKLGFHYDDHVFKLGDMLKKKSGNCLGLTLLVGAILAYHGVEADYQVILNPRDSVDEADAEMFDRLFDDKPETRLIDQQNPDLFSLREWQDDLKDSPDRNHRFVSLEHPSLSFGDKSLELTNLEDEAVHADWFPKYDRKTKLSYEQLASCVLTEEIKRLTDLANPTEAEYGKVVGIFRRAIKAWPENREAYSILAMYAAKYGDMTLAQECADKYEKIGGNDSRYFLTLYTLTSDPQYAEKAFWKDTHNLNAFYEHKISTAKDNLSKRRYLAIASWMAAFSSFVDLEDFYEHLAKNDIIDAYGEDYYTDLMEGAF